MIAPGPGPASVSNATLVERKMQSMKMTARAEARKAVETTTKVGRASLRVAMVARRRKVARRESAAACCGRTRGGKGAW